MKMINRKHSALALAAVSTGAVLVPMSLSTAQAPAGSTVMSLQRRAPAGAVVLLSENAPQDLAANWVARKTTEPPSWQADADGIIPTTKQDITSKQSFGDCQMHLEFRPKVDASGKAVGNGNSGVGIMGRYEIQIAASYGASPSTGECGAFYSQVAPRVNACRKPGEWQVYDIIFRAPRVSANGDVVSQPRATVYLNGILIQNNEEFKGPTGIQHGDFKGTEATGPIVLQGDHDPVQYRNIWVVPL